MTHDPREGSSPDLGGEHEGPSSLPASSDPMVVAGRFELGAPLGVGRRSSVMRARDRRTGFPVAVKLVSSGDGRAVDVARVAAEAEALGRMASRHVVTAHEHGEDPVLGAYLVLDVVEGVPLGPNVLGRPFLPHEVLRVARGLLAGLAASHAAGIVHHDVRPENVLVSGERLEGAVLVDFDASSAVRTRGEPLRGVAPYVAPERLAGAQGDSRSDVFSAGVLLFGLLGYPGTPEEGPFAVPLSAVPKPLSTVLERMVARDPAARFATATDALAVVLDLDTAPIEDGVDPRALPHVAVAGSEGPSRASGAPVEGSVNIGLFRLSGDPLVALRECLSQLDVVLLGALARRPSEVGRVAKLVRASLELSFGEAASWAEGSELSRAFAAALLGARARRSFTIVRELDPEALDVETHALLATLVGVLATPSSSLSALSVVRRASARLRAEPGTVRASRATLLVAEAALSVMAESRPARSAMGEIEVLSAQSEGHAVPPLDALARALWLGQVASNEDPVVAREALERAAKVALSAKSALLEARVLSELGRLLVQDGATRELGTGWLVRVEELAAHGDAPTFVHASHHDRGGACLLRGRYEDAARHYAKAKDVLSDEGETDGTMLSVASLVLTELSCGRLPEALETAKDLVEPRLATCDARTAAFAFFARSQVALASGDRSRAHRDVERARDYAARVARGARDAVGLVEIAAALLRVLEPEPPSGPSLSGTLGAHRGGAVRFLPILRAIVARVPDAFVRVPLLDAIDGALRDFGGAETTERATLPPPEATTDGPPPRPSG
ncbi:MAG: serine/threonine protein kinase [Myxococcales bacterium]|nr:serine/threonine protein kinase [Myxococcales bacterium]